MKPYYNRDGITIYCGDNRIILDDLSSNSIDLVVTSPPYDLVDEDMVTHYDKGLRDYDGYEWDFVSVADQLFRLIKPGGVVVWVVNDATTNKSETGSSFRQALYFMQCGFKLYDTMIYQTNKPPMNDRRYQASFEYMFVFVKDYLATFNPILRPSSSAGLKRSRITYRQPNGKLSDQWRGGVTATTTVLENVWYIPSGNDKSSKDKISFSQPATFPEDLPYNHIISWSNPGDLILDPFLGSGTTLKMAQQLGRRAIGIEVSKSYCAIAVERLRQPSFFSISNKSESEPKSEQMALI